jgi:hypothetical protein
MDGWCMAGLPLALNIDGAQRDFIPFHIAYAFIKTFIFACYCIPSFSWILHEEVVH